MPPTMAAPLRAITRLAAVILLTAAGLARAGPQEQAASILDATGVRGGLIVHLGCSDGRLTAALRASGAYLVHGLATDPAHVAQARATIRSRGLYGPVSADRLTGNHLPYVTNSVNLVVADELGRVPMDEVRRVLCPGGVAYVRQGNAWTKTIKPRPTTIDEWTHYLHDPSNNAVAHDEVVAPPKRLQWVGGPRYGRHHDRMSSVNAVVTSGGRVFTIFDEASPASILLPPKWSLIARDAFNGTVLWKRRLGQWHEHLWPLKSGPAQLPRRLVAVGNRVFVTLSLNAPVTALDAATGETVRIFEGTETTEELLVSDGTLVLLVDRAPPARQYKTLREIQGFYRAKWWDERPRHVVAVEANTGKALWNRDHVVLPGTLAAAAGRVFFHDGEAIVCLDRANGNQVWRSKPLGRSDTISTFFLPTLLVYKDVVLFAGGEIAGKQTGSWYRDADSMTALSVETGDVLWTAPHPPSGYRSPEDLFVLGGTVWAGETTSGRAEGVFTGRDYRTGKVTSEFAPDVETYWFHHRCHRGKATDKYLLTSRAGIEFIDVANKHWTPNHWIRGACLYGIMPANGLIYAPQHPCACYLESKLSGFNAVAPAGDGPRVPKEADEAERLEPGPAYNQIENRQSKIGNATDWPTYRHDVARSGATATAVPAALKTAWQAEVGGRLSAPVIAGGKVIVAETDSHGVRALDADTGNPLWQYTAGGRVDSPPTVHDGRILFGSADGYVYCLRAEDGALAWRLRAAPADERLVSFGRLESVWPVHGSVLVRDGAAWCVAGRSMFLDGGLHLLRLDPATGRLLSDTVLDDRDPATGKRVDDFVSWLNMPVAMSDVLSSQGDFIYMRSQPFRADGARLPLAKMPMGSDADRGAPPATQRAEHAHLFSPTGFLDDSYWHRTYWMYGSTFVSGWCGYFLSGKAAPAGKILVFDDAMVYGYGRKPRYYRWTTPMEHQVFATAKGSPVTGPGDPGDAKSVVRVALSKSLNAAGTPLTVEAWVMAEQPTGVVLARGGGAQGYVLHLVDGRPHFSVRADAELSSVAAKEKVGGRWVHLAGVLTADKNLQIFVDGVLAATAPAPSLITKDPQEAMEIGADEQTEVGNYAGPQGFTGLIDEVRVWGRALGSDVIAAHAKGSAKTPRDPALILAYAFDDGKARDTSSHANHGKAEGVKPADGKVGRALRFGRDPGAAVAGQGWTLDVPLLARAITLAGRTLFIAGPPDLVDEETVPSRLADPEVQASLVAQAEALDGAKGGLLWALSADTGRKLAEYALTSIPVFDGMAAANGRLYLVTLDGKVLCMEKK